MARARRAVIDSSTNQPFGNFGEQWNEGVRGLYVPETPQVPPQDDFLVVQIPTAFVGATSYTQATIWGRGLITFGSPTTAQINYMATLNAGTNIASFLAGFPGDYVSIGLRADPLAFELGIGLYDSTTNPFGEFDDTFDDEDFQSGIPIYDIRAATPITYVIFTEPNPDEDPDDPPFFANALFPGFTGIEFVEDGFRVVSGSQYRFGGSPAVTVASTQKVFFSDFTIVPGTPGNDVRTASDVPQTLLGEAGNDTLTGGGRHDRLVGGAGNDILTGNAGNDRIEGGDDDDRLSGGAGSDTLLGGAGNDIIIMGTGEDIVDGGAGIDTLLLDLSGSGGSFSFVFDPGTNAYNFADGLKRVSGVEALDFTGGSGDDLIRGAGGNDALRGGGGNDSLLGGLGLDTLGGGEGSDFLAGESGDDQLFGDGGRDRLFGDGGNDLLDGGSGGSSPLFFALGGNGFSGSLEDEPRITVSVLDLASSSFTWIGSYGFTLEPDENPNLFIGAVAEISESTGQQNLDYFVLVLNSAGEVVFNEAVTPTENGELSFGTSFDGIAPGNYTLEIQVTRFDGQGAAPRFTIIYEGVPARFGDEMRGGAGDDVYVVDSTDDRVIENAGEGVDEVRTSVSGVSLADNVERLVYTGAGAATLIGNGGDNRLTGGVGGDLFRLEFGGNDTANGGAGDDGFYFGGAFGALDQTFGDAGDNDQVALQGNYAGLQLTASNLQGIETIALLSGGDTRFGDTADMFYSYDMTTSESFGRNLVVNGSGLRAFENFTFNGSAEQTGSFTFFGGFGRETLTGGAGNDGFFFGQGRYEPLIDDVNGGGGTDNQVAFRGDFSSGIAFAEAGLINIQTIALLSSQNTKYIVSPTPFSYTLTMDDGNVAAGARMTITGGGLGANERLQVNGAAETDGSFRLIGGAGDDVLTGGALADQIFGGRGADALNGGLGNDSFIYTEAAHSTAASRDTISGFASGDKIDLSAIDAIAGGGNDAFTFAPGNVFTGQAGQLRLFQSGGEWRLEGDIDGNSVADLVIGIVPVGGYTPVIGDVIV